MVIEFKVSNFRSIKEESVLSMVAEPSKSKEANYWEQPLAGGDSVRLLKIAAIYGPNASGKSNILKGIKNLRQMLRKPPKAGDSIQEHDPFNFDTATKDGPTEFDLTWVGPQNVKYRYRVKFNSKVILEELLEYYPIGNKRICFNRVDTGQDELVTSVKMGADFGGKKVKVHRNQLLLSKFGNDEADETLSSFYVHLGSFGVVNATDSNFISYLQRIVIKRLIKDEHTRDLLNDIIRKADIKVKGIEIQEQKEEDYSFPPDFSEEEKKKIIERNRFQLFGVHEVYDNRKSIGQVHLPFLEESQGTQTLFMFAGLALLQMKGTGVLFVDELDTSLHPDLTRMLVTLFQSNQINPKNCQLIFTTHDTTLLDSGLLRKDQIWFTEKNEYGETDLYSLQDFDGVRETTAFEKWYHAGKFGAKPNLDELLLLL